MQRIVWIRLYSRKSDNADDTATDLKPLGSADKVMLPQELSDVVDLRRYIFNHDQFKNKLVGIQTDDVYVYSDADCKDLVPLDAMLSDIRTSASQPLRFVRPGSGSSYHYG